MEAALALATPLPRRARSRSGSLRGVGNSVESMSLQDWYRVEQDCTDTARRRCSSSEFRCGRTRGPRQLPLERRVRPQPAARDIGSESRSGSDPDGCRGNRWVLDKLSRSVGVNVVPGGNGDELRDCHGFDHLRQQALREWALGAAHQHDRRHCYRGGVIPPREIWGVVLRSNRVDRCKIGG